MTLPSSGPLTLSDIQTEFGGTNPIGINEYYAGGGLVPAGTTGTYGAVPSSGQISVQNFYGTTAFTPTYIEDVFSTYLYNGSNSNPTVVSNGIDLSGKGGLVWLKGRSGSFSTDRHELHTTNFSVGQYLSSNNNFALSSGGALTTYSNDGFTLGAAQRLSFGGGNYVSWTFRKQPKFFDIVTYTGDGTSSRAISHNLGSAPKCIFLKRTDASGNWVTLLSGYQLLLNTADAEGSTTVANGFIFNSLSTTFSVGIGTTNADVNASGGTYVAYLFASNAGGFGLTGTDNVITCGSCTADGSGNFSATLGYEPQWVLIKGANASSRWDIFDSMRGTTASSGYTSAKRLNANLSDAEDEMGNPYGLGVNATGFTGNIAQAFGGTLVYMAIRRGPMKVPTSGTSVFSAITNNNSTGTKNTTNFPVDLQINTLRDGDDKYTVDRLRGVSTNSTEQAYSLSTNSTNQENTTNLRSLFWDNTGFQTFSYYGGSTFFTPVYWNFRRAPNFFDEVCYTGTGSTPQTYSHNLGVAPELIIAKCRNTGGSAGYGWLSYCSYLNGGTNPQRYYIYLNRTDAAGGPDTTAWGNTAPTSTQFSVGAYTDNGASGKTYVAYLFASCAGVSKVGSYTGTGATQTINCGFTGGARWVMIKRTDVSGVGGWYVWDTARGMVAGTDPFLSLNNATAEVNTNTVYTTSVGFQIVATSAGINVSGGTYIYLAIA